MFEEFEKKHSRGSGDLASSPNGGGGGGGAIGGGGGGGGTGALAGGRGGLVSVGAMSEEPREGF